MNLSTPQQKQYYGPPGRARSLVESAQDFYLSAHARKRPDHDVLLTTVGSLGERIVVFVYAVSSDMICISVEQPDDPSGFCDTIFASVEQCGFRIRHYKPEHTALERRIVGFAPPESTG